MILATVNLSTHWGYLILFLLIAAESSGVPLPGETALITGGVLASQGHMSIELVVIIAAAAAILGDNVGYMIGRTGGRKLLERPGFMERSRREILRQGEPFFDKHGAKAVFLGRWFAGLRIAAAWLAGIHRMHWLTFVFWNALGGVAWAATVGLLSYYLGSAVEGVFKYVGIFGVVVAIALVVAYLVRRRRQDAAAG